MSINLFQTASNLNADDATFVLVDVSSLISLKHPKGSDVITVMIHNLFDYLTSKNIKTFKVIWSTSPSQDSDHIMSLGYHVENIPFVVGDGESYNVLISTAKKMVDRNNPTSYHSAIDHFPEKWINSAKHSSLIILGGDLYVSEDTIFDVKKTFGDSIVKFLTRHPNMMVDLLMVDRNSSMFVNYTMGYNIYGAMCDNNLDNRVSFFSVNYPDIGTKTIISKNKIPPNYVAYGDKYFNIYRESEFLNFINTEIKNIKDYKIWNLVRKMASTVKVIILKRSKTKQSSDLCISMYVKCLTNFEAHEELRLSIPIKDILSVFVEDVHEAIDDLFIEKSPYPVYYKFTCPISGEDTSKGGYVLPSHNNGYIQCFHRGVFSNKSLNLRGDIFICPFCNLKINKSEIDWVGSEPPPVDTDVTLEVIPNPSLKFTDLTISSEERPMSPIIRDFVLIQMKGTVGCGKSTATKILHDKLLARGYKVHVASMDSKLVPLIGKGVPMKTCITNAVNVISKEVRSFVESSGQRALIIDTCGDFNRDSKIFGVSLPVGTQSITFYPNLYDHEGLNKKEFLNHTHDYMCWSLRNVIKRDSKGVSSRIDGYSLNPDTSGVHKCSVIHSYKMKRVFPQQFERFNMYFGSRKNPKSKSEIMSMINSGADNYASIATFPLLVKNIDEIISNI